MIEAKIIEDSISPTRARLTTFQLRYPRFIHAEVMTHRVFSRNASSSRAIPTKRLLDDIEQDPALPIYWGKNQKGMQAREKMDSLQAKACQDVWLKARDSAIAFARTLEEMGLHKQLVNRITEPWAHISVVLTATEWDNFFSLRCHPDAQPEFEELANQMRDLYYSNTPRCLEVGQWHLPYVSDEEYRNYCRFRFADLLKASVARCARVSYLTHDKKKPDIDLDVGLHDKLFGSKHSSPFEHQGTPNIDPSVWSGNLKGWIQYRKTLKGECCTSYERPK
jgi:thymidylate synthase ThyX